MDYRVISIFGRRFDIILATKRMLTYHEGQKYDGFNLWWSPHTVVLNLSHAVKQGNSLLTAAAGFSCQCTRKDQSKNIDVFPIQGVLSISLNVRLKCAIHQAIEKMHLFQKLRDFQHRVHNSHFLFIDLT